MKPIFLLPSLFNPTFLSGLLAQSSIQQNKLNAMKSQIMTIILICIVGNINKIQTQVNGNISELPLSIRADGALPDSSAMLDVQSTTKGVLVPRMTTTQRTAIATPATSLMVFDTDTGSFWFYNGSFWQEVTSDNLGDHTATQNLKLNGNYLSGDGGNEGIFVDGTGNVGIGTTSPSKKLSVLGNADFSGILNVGSSSNFTGHVGIVTAASSIFPLTIQSHDPNRLWIDLKDNDGTSVWQLDNAGGGLDFVEKTTTAVQKYRLYLQPGGNIGIGTSSPTSKLDVNGTVTAGAFVGDGSGLTNLPGDNLGNHTATQNLKLNGNYLSGDGGNEGVFVDGSGNVGINASTPKGILHVGGDYYGRGHLWFHANEGDGSSGTAYLQARDDSGTSSINMQLRTQNAGSIVDAVQIAANGNVGIGTSSPDARLDIEGGALLAQGTTGATPISGAGTRLMWVPGKAAFRAGEVAGTQWDAGNIGASSFVGGGYSNTASGNGAFVGSGESNTASGNNSFIGGGIGLLSQAYSEAVFGTYNTYQTPASANSYSFNDRVFVIGNGTSDSDRSDAFTVLKNGRIGIGTANPFDAKVSIIGALSRSLTYGYLNGNGNTGTASGTAGYSLYADERIAAVEFNAFSDARIKNIIGVSDHEQDLSTLMGIEVTDYTLLDTLAKGTQSYKKVIAQQVETVFPQAVSTITDVVPDIFQRAEVVDGWVQLATDLQPGERVKIITGQGAEVYEVTQVEESRFRLAALKTPCLPTGKKNSKPETVFVYGREVDDFHTVDYEAIAMLNVSATQEQQRIIQVQQQRIEELESQVAKIGQLEAIVQQLQQAILKPNNSSFTALVPTGALTVVQAADGK